MKELSIDATVENIAPVTDFVNRELEGHNCPQRILRQIDVAIDELFSNIAHYAYNPDVGPATVRVEVTQEPLAVVITFIDHGTPYDPFPGEPPTCMPRWRSGRRAAWAFFWSGRPWTT